MGRGRFKLFQLPDRRQSRTKWLVVGPCDEGGGRERERARWWWWKTQKMEKEIFLEKKNGLKYETKIHRTMDYKLVGQANAKMSDPSRYVRLCLPT